MPLKQAHAGGARSIRSTTQTARVDQNGDGNGDRNRSGKLAIRLGSGHFEAHMMIIKNVTYASAFALVTLPLLGCASQSFGTSSDFFVGKFVSETRENFGSNDPGEYVIDVRKEGEKYVLSYSHKGRGMFTVEGFACSPDLESYLVDHPPGEAHLLCFDQGKGYMMPLFAYSENGIKVPMLGAVYKTQYYAHVQWFIRGFRKIQ